MRVYKSLYFLFPFVVTIMKFLFGVIIKRGNETINQKLIIIIINVLSVQSSWGVLEPWSEECKRIRRGHLAGLKKRL